MPGPFTLTGAAPSLEIKKVAATDINAPSQTAVLATAIIYPSPGATIKITNTSIANVMASGTALEIFNDPLVRGGQAKVRLKINNLGSARMEFLTSQNNGPTQQVKIMLKDQDGNLLSTGSLNQQIGSLIVNSGNYATARLMPGESILTDPITFTVPQSAPYKVYIQADLQNTYYHYNQPDMVIAPGLKQTTETTITETSYRAEATTDKNIYKQGEAIIITGQAISNSVDSGTGVSPVMPNVPVKLGISVKGFDRYYTVNTDSAGNFTYTFIPGINEAGQYSVWAIHPDITDRTVQAQFNIVGLNIAPEFANIKMAKNSSYDIPVTLKNLGDTNLAGLSFTLTESAGITAGIINSGDVILKAGETRNITLRITADSSAPDNGYAALTVTATPSPLAGEGGGEGLSAALNVNITLIQAIPIISTTPSYIDTGLKRGTQKLETFTITNTGLDTLKNARLEGPSTTWMQLTNDKNIGDLKPGASATIGILLKPGETIPQAIYDDRIVIYSDNHIPYTFNIQATVTSNAIGNLMFDVLNELNEDVSGASITLTEVNGFGGGGCGSASITTAWEQVICPNTANARTTSKTSSHTITYGSDCGGTGSGLIGGGGGSYTGGGGGGQGGGGWLPGGSPTTLATEECFSPAGGSGPAGGDNGNKGGAPSPGDKGDKGCGGDEGGKCEPPPCTDCPGSSVIITNGTYEFSAIDLKIPARGMDIELRRTYRSNRIIAAGTGPIFAESEDGPLGYGWMTPFFVQITNGDTFVDADGRYWTFKKDASGNFLTDTASGMTLKKTTTGFTLKKLDAFTRTFDANGKLLTKTDNFGNTWTMTYDTASGGATVGWAMPTAVKDAINRTVLTFTYDTNNHITQATDIAGRQVNYEYWTSPGLVDNYRLPQAAFFSNS